MCAAAGLCGYGGEAAPGRRYHPLPSRVPGGACDLLSTGEDRAGWRSKLLANLDPSLQCKR
ncbi:hypothetical protein K5549_004993 [Capra hircus]|uniref:Uncharacterized protein n=1 Tax=Capra hircus TaxID=9925 RepID=A0A452E7F8_CAPHI|nr:hypothetical protein K5549_004993 [Capra hircus]